MAHAGPVAGYIGAFFIQSRWCLACDTKSDIVTVADPTDGHLDFALTDSFSVEAWVNCQSTDDQNFVKKGTPADTGAGYSLSVGAVANMATFSVCDGANASHADATTSDIGNDSLWHHIVGVRDVASGGNDNIIIYVDGVDCDSASDTLSDTLANASDLIIGPDSDASRSGADQLVGMVRVWDCALTAAQISDLANGDFPAAAGENLVGEWMLEEGTGTVAWDSSSYRTSGTRSNATWSDVTYDTETNDAVGTGDGTDTTWQLSPTTGGQHINVDKDNLTVTVGGTAKYLGTDFSMTPKGLLTFKTAPAGAAAIVATYRYYRQVLEVGGFHAWTVDWTGDTIDITDFRSAGPRYFVGGQTAWTGSAERHWISPFKGIDRTVTNEFIIRFYTNEDDNRYFHGWAHVNGISTTASPDSVLEESITFQGTNVLSQETS